MAEAVSAQAALGTITVPSFTEQDQIAFGRLSGDINPVHVDSDAARRTMFGRPIVHGMHLVLRAIDVLAKTGMTQAYCAISARFHRPVYLGEPLSVTTSPRLDGGLDLVLSSDNAQLAAFSLSGPPIPVEHDWVGEPCAWDMTPRDLAIEQMADAKGSLPLPYDAEEIRRQFPALAALYGPGVVAHMMAITRVIGMEVPGLHSMFATFSLRLLGGTDTRLDYRVARTSAKLSHVKVMFESATLGGSAEAFVRPTSRALGFHDVAAHVRTDEFAGRRCLVVGGSRGLGLVTAYMIAAGGGEVVLTYRVGKEEADTAVQAIRDRGLAASALQMDVHAPEPAFQALSERGFAPTDMFYFATPHIFVRKKKLFENDIFNDFVRVYVDDFMVAVDRAAAIAQGKLSVFYPSSQALDSPLADLAEYCIAKAGGEAACDMLNRFNGDVSVIVERLPRIETDQTSTLIDVPTADPVPIMIDVCRRMRQQPGQRRA